MPQQGLPAYREALSALHCCGPGPISIDTYSDTCRTPIPWTGRALTNEHTRSSRPPAPGPARPVDAPSAKHPGGAASCPPGPPTGRSTRPALHRGRLSPGADRPTRRNARYAAALSRSVRTCQNRPRLKGTLTRKSQGFSTLYPHDAHEPGIRAIEGALDHEQTCPPTP